MDTPFFIPATAILTRSSVVKAATAELQELDSFWQTSSTAKEIKQIKDTIINCAEVILQNVWPPSKYAWKAYQIGCGLYF